MTHSTQQWKWASSFAKDIKQYYKIYIVIPLCQSDCKASKNCHAKYS